MTQSFGTHNVKDSDRLCPTTTGTMARTLAMTEHNPTRSMLSRMGIIAPQPFRESYGE